MRLDEADLLPYDFPVYAAEIARAENEVAARAQRRGGDSSVLKSINDASAELTASAMRASQALHSIESASPDSAAAGEH